jgi:hypothetical protein
MMDFYSIEQIAFAKVAEDRQIAAAAHLADAANAVRLAARKPGRPLAGILNRLAHAFGYVVPAQLTTAHRPQVR